MVKCGEIGGGEQQNELATGLLRRSLTEGNSKMNWQLGFYVEA